MRGAFKPRLRKAEEPLSGRFKEESSMTILLIIALTLVAIIAFCARLAIGRARTTLEQVLDLDTPMPADVVAPQPLATVHNGRRDAA